MNSKAEYIKTRREYISLIKKELLGPGSEVSVPDEEHELISSAPDVRYSIGILFPPNNKFNANSDDNIKKENTFSEDFSAIDTLEETTNADLDNLNVHKENFSDLNDNEDDDAEDIRQEGNLDEEIGLASQNMPSSMGITFFTKGNSEYINCNISFGTYRHAKDSDCKIPFYPNNSTDFVLPTKVSDFIQYDEISKCLKFRKDSFKWDDIKHLKDDEELKLDGNHLFEYMCKLIDQTRGFVRVPHNVDVRLDFSHCRNGYIDQNDNLDGCQAKVTALRRKIDDDLYSVTIMLVNSCQEKSSGTKCLFQPGIRVDTKNNDFIFSEYSSNFDFDGLEEEEKSLELLYRNKKVYGTGLGTSASWNIDSDGKGELFNDFFPEVEVPQMDYDIPLEYSIEGNTLSMKYLSDLNHVAKSDKIFLLNRFVESYKKWIDKLNEKKDSLEKKFQEIALYNIKKCTESFERMKRGIEALDKNEDYWAAFELANRAMFMQRVHLKMQESKHDRYYDDEDAEFSETLRNLDYLDNQGLTADNYKWRPFQLAFLLMSIVSITDEKSDDRNVVDLIWFPTGGGKTEAYLGLTAFTIFFRRLHYSAMANGTSVIMRYTLRLLAAQQFTRAATLICACEYIRRESLNKKTHYKSYALGDEKITIGLWIGGSHIPNRNSEAKTYLSKLNKAKKEDLQETKDMYNKFQILKCPWCGTKLVKDIVEGEMRGLFGFRMNGGKNFELFCPQECCDFNSVLPLQIIDEELYRKPPTLLFGTVDKFAMLPWKREIGSFFGLETNNRTPELIIQDELHLISGPLGSMTGLYEAAIDALCKSKGVKTKIIASTATIRRAKEQCSALYDRDVLQFPHPGLDADDSFFARESIIDYQRDIFGRIYVGLMPSGKTKAMMEIRSIAALLQKINTMNLPEDIKNNYWTLTTYFNSLKDLGKCSTLVEDDVKDFIKRIAYRLGAGKDGRRFASADELTSRVSTTELSRTLDKLELNLSKENIEKGLYASTILLATNMISVGLDISRLNVMLLVGQPKLTSEYIQASSRIGRSLPGVAFTMYDWSKSRDRSHYEQFKQYHESFYKYVEPTGVTPFSGPARDRALIAVVVALLRHLNDDLRAEDGAANFSKIKYAESIEKIKKFIINREKSIVSRLNTGMKDDSEKIEKEIDQALDDWNYCVESYKNERFVYGERYMVNSFIPEKEHRLLKSFNSDMNDTSAFNTMTSMRNVDSSVTGNLVIWRK